MSRPKFNPKRDIPFNTRVTATRHDEAASCWRIRTDTTANPPPKHCGAVCGAGPLLRTSFAASAAFASRSRNALPTVPADNHDTEKLSDAPLRITITLKSSHLPLIVSAHIAA